MITIKIFVFNPFQENTFILHDETKEAVIIDAGCYSMEEEELLSAYIIRNGLKPVRLLSTHCHIDHILGNRYVSKTFNLVPEAHKEDEFLAESVQSYGASFGIETGPVPAIGKYLYEGMKVEFGNSSLDIFHIPGHSPGGIVFHSLDQGILIAGDVLFSGSIGRTDLPGGNYEKLITNIRNKLFVLDDNTVVYPGHGPATTIGQEKKTNPFFN